MIAENNQSFAIKIEHLHYITKDKNKATSFIYVDKDAEKWYASWTATQDNKVVLKDNIQNHPFVFLHFENR